MAHSRSLFVGVLVFLSGIASGGAFDDALFWIRGPEDVNGDGWIKTTRLNDVTDDVKDALKAGDADSLTHEWEGIGPYTNIHVVSDAEITMPYANVKTRSSFLRFDQTSWVEGSVTNAIGGCIRNKNLPPMTNSVPHTVFLRFRVDSFIDDGTPATICALGYSAGTGGKAGGWLLQLVPDGEGAFWFKVIQGRPKDNAGQTGVGTKELKEAYESTASRMHTNQWVDVVFTCVYGNISIYSCREGGRFTAETSGIGWNASPQASWSQVYAFGNAGSDYSESDPDTSCRQFRGDIAQIALWERTLTEDEAREVMAWPRNDRWRLGVKDGTSDQFAGSAGTTVDASAVNPFKAVPPALAANESFTVGFDMDVTNSLGCAQALRVKTTSLSAASATFSASVNGEKARFFHVKAGQEGVMVFPAKMFVQGANSLTLKCVSLSGGTEACLDAVALGGAWNVGYANDSHAEFAYTTASGITWKQNALHAEDTDWKRTVINMAPSGKWATNSVSALIDASVSDVRDGRFVLRGKVSFSKEETGAPMRVELLVNGESAGSHTFPAEGAVYEDAVYPIPAGTLVDGVNTFSLINRTSEDGTDADGVYVSMDCRYFEYKPDPLGTVIVVR